MLRFYKLIFPTTLLLVSACATNGQTTLVGMGVGTLVGGIVGALADASPKGRLRGQSMFCGSTIGGLVGAGAGYLFHPNDPKKAEMAEAASQANALINPKAKPPQTIDHPLVVPPQVETRYVDDQVKGNTFVPGHLEFQMIQPGQWNKE